MTTSVPPSGASIGDAVERAEARALRFEDRSLDPPLASAAAELDRDDVHEVARPAAARLDDLEAALRRRARAR